MLKLFELAAGTIIGRDHCGRGNLLSGKNNQDATSWKCGEMIVGAVCDGCSEGQYSELGARLGANLLVQAIQSRQGEFLQLSMENGDELLPTLLERVRIEVLGNIEEVAVVMCGSGSLSRVIGEHFLFTTLGMFITPAITCIFSVGDGIYYANGLAYRVGPFPGNMPPYLAYELIGSKIDPKLLTFSIQSLFPTQELESLLVGTDGVVELEGAATKNVPGKTELIGPISQFWTEDRFFVTDQIRRRLALINSEVVTRDSITHQMVRHAGLLSDDTSFIVIRRKTQKG